MDTYNWGTHREGPDVQVRSALRWDEAAGANTTGRGTAEAEQPEGEAAVGYPLHTHDKKIRAARVVSSWRP